MREVLLGAAALVVGALGLGLAVMTSTGAAESSSDAPPYEVYRPASLSKAKPVPLVLGLGGSATKIGSGFNGFADRYGFVVAYPEPNLINVPPNEDASQTARIAYLSDVIDNLRVSQNIDPNRVYVTGGSRSGIESYRVACRLANKVTAIGSVAGSLLAKEVATCKPARAVSVLEIHGTSDSAVPYNGNQFYPPVRTTNAFWLKSNVCSNQAKVSTSGPVTIETWSPCKDGTSVRLITYAGGDHGWPRNSQIDTTAQLWAFFSAQATQAAATALTARVTRLSVSSGRHRLLTIRLTVNKDATVRTSLVHKGRGYAAKTFQVASGNRVLRLAIAKSAKAGTYVLKLRISTADGSAQTIQKSVRVR